MGVDAEGGRRTQESGHADWDTGRELGHAGRHVWGPHCGLLQGHTGWLPECHAPTYRWVRVKVTDNFCDSYMT